MATNKLKSLEKALRLLKLFTCGKHELRVSEISEGLGYHKSSLQRLISTLVAEGFLERSPDRPAHYRLGVETLLLGNAAKENLNLRSVAKPFLLELAETTRETVHLSVTDDFQIYYLEKIDSSHSIRIITEVGQRIPIHSSSMGKSIMAYMPTRELDQGIAKHGLPALTPNTITTREELDAELTRIREQGYACDKEEWNVGVMCVGAPVFDENGNAVAGVSCSGPASRFSEQILSKVAEEVRKTAGGISRRLGYRTLQQTEK